MAGMIDCPPAENVSPGTRYSFGSTMDSRMYSSGVCACPRYPGLLITSTARAVTPASDGPTICVPGCVEWQLKHAGGVCAKSASPSAIGSADAAPGAGVPSVIPCDVAALTTIGRGGQFWLSMFEIH